MRIEHITGYTIVQGTEKEHAKILKWIDLANCEIIVDECEDDEVSYTVGSKSWNTTQAERSEDFKYAKKLLK